MSEVRAKSIAQLQDLAMRWLAELREEIGRSFAERDQRLTALDQALQDLRGLVTTIDQRTAHLAQGAQPGTQQPEAAPAQPTEEPEEGEAQRSRWEEFKRAASAGVRGEPLDGGE